MKNDIPLLKRLGAVPFWRGQDRFLPSLEAMYRRAGERAAAALERTRRPFSVTAAAVSSQEDSMERIIIACLPR